MKRSLFNLSYYKLLTFDMGELVPVGCMEVLPGDTIQMSSSALVRVSPLVSPVMHPVHVRIHHWYIPNRIVWDGFEPFITGGPDGNDATVAPTTTAGSSSGSLADYLGVPPGYTGAVSALPFRAYAKTWNEHYRDQDLQTELPVSKASGLDGVTSTSLQKVAWEKDYLTTARPWTQKGPEVTVPIGDTAPVVPITANAIPTFWDTGAAASAGALVRSAAGANTAVNIQNAGNATAGLGWNNPNLQADLVGAVAANINELRTAFALQRYQEARARYGSRYTEYLAYLGVQSSDARLQRPEYLGGGKQVIQFSEVLQTAPNVGGSGVGDLAGHGMGAMRSNRFRRFIEEHGWVLTLMSIKPKTMYAQALPRHWTRTTKEDYWQRELQHIGQQEVFNREALATHTVPDGIFGYQDRYDEYRRCESSVAGDFRTTMDHWHYARIFASDVSLNAAFVQSDPTKRVYQEQTADAMWVMVNHSIQARRMVARSGTSFIS